MQIDLTHVFLQLLILFIIMMCGYAAKRLKITNAAFDKTLSKLVLDLTMPAMILASVLTREETLAWQQVLITVAVAFAAYAVLIALAEIAVRLMLVPKGRRGVFRFMCIFGNVGFVGFPVISAIFGPGAIVYAAVFNIPFNVLVFTLGVLYLAGDKVPGEEDKEPVKITFRMFTTPCTVACLLVIILCLLGVHQVPVLTPAVDTLGSMTTPAALIIIGSNLANIPVKDLLGSWRLYVTALVRLLVVPACLWGVFHFFVTDPLLLGVLVVVCSMPVATNGTLLCFQYGGDMRTMSQTTFISTLLAFVTIPVVVSVLVTLL